MIGWWPGDGSGSDYIGVSDVTGGFGFGPGEVSKAFTFGGTQFASAGNAPALDLTGAEVTIDGWVNPSVDMTNEAVFFGKTGDGAIQYLLEWETGSLEGRVNNANVAFTYTPPTGTWTHLALVYNGSTTPNVTVYVNGAVLTSSSTQNGNINSTSSPFVIGGTLDGRDFNGSIDEVEVFGRALSAGEIQSLYAVGSGGKCKCNLPLKPGVQLTEFTGAPANDGFNAGRGTVFSANAGFAVTGAGFWTNPAGNITITVKLWQSLNYPGSVNDVLLASQTTALSDSGLGYYDVTFPSSVTLVPGSTYHIEVSFPEDMEQ